MNRFHFGKTNLILLLLGIALLFVGYSIMAKRKSPYFTKDDIMDFTKFQVEVLKAQKNISDFSNLDFSNEESSIKSLNALLKKKFVSVRLFDLYKFPPEIEMMIRSMKINSKVTPAKAISIYKTLPERKKLLFNRYVLESIFPLSLSKYINHTGDNSLSVIILMIAYIIVFPLSIIYKEKSKN